jgi:aldehyde dehydrogenase (NAD+)
MTSDKRVPLISATGSTRMGKIVQTVAGRLGKIIIRIRWKQCDYCNTRRRY